MVESASQQLPLSSASTRQWPRRADGSQMVPALPFVSWQKLRAAVLPLPLLVVCLVASALFFYPAQLGTPAGSAPPAEASPSPPPQLPQRDSLFVNHASGLPAVSGRPVLNHTPFHEKGLVVVMPFTKHDLGKMEENLALWDRFSPCSAARRASDDRSAEPAGSSRIRRRRVKAAFYFYYNGIVDEETRNFLWKVSNRTNGLNACFDMVGYTSAFLTGDDDRYDPQRLKSNWVRGPNSQFYSLFLGDEHDQKDGEGPSALPLEIVRQLTSLDNGWTGGEGEIHDSWPLSSSYQYLFHMEPDTRPIRSDWLGTLLYESGLPPFDSRAVDPDEEVPNERFWMKGSAFRGKCILQKLAVKDENERCTLLGPRVAAHINGNALYNLGDSRFVDFLAKVRNSEYSNWPYDVAIHLYLNSPIREADNRGYLHLFRHSAFVQNFGRYPFNVSEIEENESGATAFIHSDKQAKERGVSRERTGSPGSGDALDRADAENPSVDPGPSWPPATSLALGQYDDLKNLVEAQMEKGTRNLAVSFLPGGHMRSRLNALLTKNWIMAWEHFHRASVWKPKSMLQRFTTGDVTAEADEAFEQAFPRLLLFVFTKEDFAEVVKLFEEILLERTKESVWPRDTLTPLPVYRLDPERMISAPALRDKASVRRILEANAMALLMGMHVKVLRSPITAFWLRDPFTYFSPAAFYDFEVSTASPTSAYFSAAAAGEVLFTNVSYARPSARTVAFFEGLSGLHSDRPQAETNVLVSSMLKANFMGIRYRLLEPALFPDSDGFFEKKVNLRAGVNVPYFLDAGNWVHKVLNPPINYPKSGHADASNSTYGFHAWRYILEENKAWFLDDRHLGISEDNGFQRMERSRYLASYERPMDNGLNNARSALKCALAISLILNRTLVLPEFHAHHRLNTPVGLDYYFDPQIFLDTWRGVVDVVPHSHLASLLPRRKPGVSNPPLFYLDVGYFDVDYRLLGVTKTTPGIDEGRMLEEDGGMPWIVPNAVGVNFAGSPPWALAPQFGVDRRLVKFTPSQKHHGASVEEIARFLGPWNHLPLIELSRTFRRFNGFAGLARTVLHNGSFPYAADVDWERIKKLGPLFDDLFEASLVPSRIIRKVTEAIINRVKEIAAIDAMEHTGGRFSETAGYGCLHLRRGDFLAVHKKLEALSAEEAADQAARRFAKLVPRPADDAGLRSKERLSLTLYLSSDESSSPELQAAFRKRFTRVLTLSDVIAVMDGDHCSPAAGKLQPPSGQSRQDVREMCRSLRSFSAPDELFGKDQRLGMAEQEVCASADHFVGNSYSTFSVRICQMRKRAGIYKRPCSDMHSRPFP